MKNKYILLLLNKNKKILPYVKYMVIFFLIMFVIFLALFFQDRNKKEYLEYNIPVNLKIPKLNIDTEIISVGLNSIGSVDANFGPDIVGWFNGSPIPGQKGNSIIDGHSGWKGNNPAVFDNLFLLKVGDKIYIENNKGSISVFIVKEIDIFVPGENYSRIFIPEDDKAYLNLITCSGVWDNINKTHKDRLVIFSEKEIL